MKRFKVGDKVVLDSKEDIYVGYDDLTIGNVYVVTGDYDDFLTIPETEIYLLSKSFIPLSEHRESKLKLLLDL